MAADGVSHTEIAWRMNEEDIPTRYQYHRLKGDNFPDKQPHVKIKKWDNSAVRDIITDETYLGTLFWNRAKCGMDTDKKRVEQPREKWIIVEDQHEALVTKELYDKANENMVGRDMSGRKTGRKKKRYLCRSRTRETENDCQRVAVRRKALKNAVLEQMRVMADMLAGKRDACRKAHKDGRIRMEELEWARGEAQAELDQM